MQPELSQYQAMSIAAGIRAAQEAFYEETGRTFERIHISEEDFLALCQEAGVREDMIPDELVIDDEIRVTTEFVDAE